jgi:hypothetical protein
MKWKYIEKSSQQIRNSFNEKRRKGLNGFKDFNDFKDWYDQKVKDKSCYYCGLTERESQRIIHDGLLTSKRFPLKGITSQGVNRGYWLEIDRKNPIGLYSRENCEPSCYFCNNDKSDVFTDEQYEDFIKNRPAFLRKLLSEK